MKVGFKFDPFELAGVEPPTGSRLAAAKRAIAEYVAAEVIASAGDGKSPVAGGKWKRSLSPEYKERKRAQGGNAYADMILDGDMLSALDVVSRAGTNLELQITGKQGNKADGHNNHSGRSSLPLREFIPKDGQTFKRSIISGIREIAEAFAAEAD